jgi:hypothetical protein
MAASRRKLETIYRRTSALSDLNVPHADPLTSAVALAVQRVVVQRVFWRLFQLDLDSTAAEVLAQYGNASTAVRDFLGFCGFGDDLPEYATLDFDVDAFMSFAAWRHRQRSLTRETKSIMRKGVEVSTRLSSLWVMARAATREFYWRYRGRNLEAVWLRMRQKAYHTLTADRKRLDIDLASDLENQRMLVSKLAFNVYTRAMSAMALLADHMFNTNPAGAESESHEIAFQAALDGLRMGLGKFLESCSS